MSVEAQPYDVLVPINHVCVLDNYRYGEHICIETFLSLGYDLFRGILLYQ